MDYAKKPKGLKRIVLATGHSLRALRWLLTHEAAFKQEVLASFLLLLFLAWLDIPVSEKLELFAAVLFVMFAEVFNTSIEAVVDRIGLEHHELSGLAKDLGSFAVMIALIIAAIVWAKVLLFPLM